MMKVYFFSRHVAMVEMVEALGGIDEQFRGTVSRVHQEDDMIAFTEAPIQEGGKPRNHQIPVDSIIILVGPLPLQKAFLRAGAKTLLVPQTRRESSADGKVSFVYSGLLQIHKIRVVTTQWHGRSKSDEECIKERSEIAKE